MKKVEQNWMQSNLDRFDFVWLLNIQQSLIVSGLAIKGLIESDYWPFVNWTFNGVQFILPPQGGGWLDLVRGLQKYVFKVAGGGEWLKKIRKRGHAKYGNINIQCDVSNEGIYDSDWWISIHIVCFYFFQGFLVIFIWVLSFTGCVLL